MFLKLLKHMLLPLKARARTVDTYTFVLHVLSRTVTPATVILMSHTSLHPWRVAWVWFRPVLFTSWDGFWSSVMSSSYNGFWSSPPCSLFCNVTWTDFKSVLEWKIGKHVLSHLKTCALKTDFVLGVGGGRLHQNFLKILMVSPPLPHLEAGSRVNQKRRKIKIGWKIKILDISSCIVHFMGWFLVICVVHLVRRVLAIPGVVPPWNSAVHCVDPPGKPPLLYTFTFFFFTVRVVYYEKIKRELNKRLFIVYYSSIKWELNRRLTLTLSTFLKRVFKGLVFTIE